MRWFDTHAHLQSEELLPYLLPVLERAKAAGVCRMLVVGTSAKSSEMAVQLAEQHACLFAAVGIQPNHVAEMAQGDWERIVALASHEKVLAIGETGLDRYWNDTPFEQQEAAFDLHLRLSQSLNKPFVVHMRDCGDDVVRMLREARQRGPLQGLMHSFTGDEALARECLELGLYMSFAGMVTYKKSDALRAVAAIIPSDRIVIETDAPYLSPHPVRAQRPNEPALMVHTAACLAEVRGVSLDTFSQQTWENACKLFGCASD